MSERELQDIRTRALSIEEASSSALAAELLAREKLASGTWMPAENGFVSKTIAFSANDVFAKEVKDRIRAIFKRVGADHFTVDGEHTVTFKTSPQGAKKINHYLTDYHNYSTSKIVR